MELASANEKQEVGKCGHFSIRGFVAEVRRKDSKMCWPFPMATSIKDVDGQAVLPPLHVADFRWWDCENCLKKTGAITATMETQEIADHHDKPIEPSVCCHGNSVKTSHVDTLKLLSDLPQASREQILGGRNVDSHITVDLNCHEYNPSLYSGKQDKNTAMVKSIGEDSLISVGCDGGAEANVNQAAYKTFSSVNKGRPFLTGERFSNGTGKVNTNFKPDKKGSTSSAGKTAIACKPVCQDNNASEKAMLTLNNDDSVERDKANYGTGFHDIVFDKRKEKQTSKTPVQICQKETELSMNNIVKITDQQSKEVLDHGICVVDVDKSKALNTLSGNIGKIHSRDLDESDYGSSEDDETSIGNNIDDEHCTSQCGFSGGSNSHRRKTRKLRTLDDIIKSEVLCTPCNDDSSSRDVNTNHIKTEGVHSKSARDALTSIDTGPDAKSSTLVQANDKAVILDKTKKRKRPHDEYEVPFKNSCQPATKEVGTFKGDAATRDIDIAIVNSESDADSSVAIGLDSISNSYLIKHGKNKNFTLVKKKNKMHQIDDEDSSFRPWQDGVHRVIQNSGRDTAMKCTEAEIGPSKSVEDVSTGGGSCPDLVSEAVAQSYAKKVLFNKNKCVNSHSKEKKSSVKSCKERMTGENQSTLSNTAIKYKDAAAVPFGPSQDAFAGGTQCAPSHVGANRRPTISKKQNSILQVEVGADMPQFENGGFPILCQPEASSGTCNYEKSVAQRHPSTLKNQFDQTATKTSEQAALDDIPMEIVELLAKNQHERRLSNAELAVGNNYCSSMKSEKKKVPGPKDLTEVLGYEMLRLLHEKNSLMQKAQSSNEESSSKKVESTKRKLEGYGLQDSSKHNTLHSNISQPEKFLATMVSGASSHETLSGGTQFPVSASSRNCSNQNIGWNEDVVGHKCSPTCLQSSEAIHRCQTFLQQSSCREDHHFWSSMIPNCMNFKINNTQNFTATSSNVGAVSQCLELFPKGNMHVNHGLKSPNPCIIHPEKQNLRFNSEANKRTDVGHPFACQGSGNEYHKKMMAPLDFYANESIPAMHLLRLMDAGVSSTAPLNRDKCQDFSKQPSFPYNHAGKDFTEFEFRAPKHIHQPSSDCFLKSYPLGKPCFHVHSVPEDSTVGSSLQKYDNFRWSTGSRCNFLENLVSDSLIHQVKGKTTNKKQLREPRGRKLDRSAFDSSSNHGRQKGFLSASDSMPFVVHSQGMEDSTTCFQVDVINKSGTAWPITKSSRTELCTTNRNPADFTVPEAGNAYMIGPGDLKRGKTTMPRGRSGLTDLEGHKRQRMMKLTSI